MEPLQQTYNLFKTPQLKNPTQAYDPTKTLQQNMEGQANPGAQDIINAFRTPQQMQQLQQQQKPSPVQQVQETQTAPVIRSTDELAKAMGMSVETIDYSGNSILQLLKLRLILPCFL